MIATNDIGFSYGSNRILDNLSIRIDAGETVMLTGPNGTGKSTLLRLLAGVLRPGSGSVDHGLPPGSDPRRSIAYLPESLSIYESMTVQQAADFHAGIFGTAAADMSLARSAGVETSDRISDLSVGQRVLVQLSIVLSTKPRLALIDEVLHAVDPFLRGLVFEKLIGVMDRCRPAILMVNLNFHEIENIVDRVIFLGHESVRLDERVQDLKACTRSVAAEGLTPDCPILGTQTILGERRHVVYPYRPGDAEPPPGSVQGMDLSEILTAFMGNEYDAS